MKERASVSLELGTLTTTVDVYLIRTTPVTVPFLTAAQTP